MTERFTSRTIISEQMSYLTPLRFPEDKSRVRAHNLLCTLAASGARGTTFQICELDRGLKDLPPTISVYGRSLPVNTSFSRAGYPPWCGSSAKMRRSTARVIP